MTAVMSMLGINLDRPILYKHASLRFFKPGEYHITRTCPDDVLVMVYDGVLRFTEDSVPFEIHPGQYHIQRQNSVQSGDFPSLAPQYLYVHFKADWTEQGPYLPRSGTFSYGALKPLMEQMDSLSHSGAPYVAKAGALCNLLTALHGDAPKDPLAEALAIFVAKHCHEEIPLERLCKQFHFSKNHIITLFKNAFGMTPVAYINHLRLQKAEQLLEATSDSIDAVALGCGFRNYSHFYKLFLRKNGRSPEQWRSARRTMN